VRTVEEMAQTRVQMAQTMTGLLMSVASVSLLVGGIGIMNIMLVSVTERTREIGLRMAVGARTRDILRQFLAEAVSLSLVGGLLGIALGVLVSQVLVQFMGWPATITLASIVIAFAFSAAVGVFFGYYPARTAAQLDPIDALRYE
jgi:putative ABC transport system permease protein